MKLIINGSAVQNSSLGVRRYFEGVLPHLEWPEGYSITHVHPWRSLDRILELTWPGSRNAVLWSPAHRGPLRALHHIVTVHDCINVEYVYRRDWRRPALKWASTQLLNNAAAVVAISQATKAALVRNYNLDPVRIIVIPSSCLVSIQGASVDVNRGERQAPDASVASRQYVLMVTNFLPHKNTLQACTALAKSAAARKGMVLRVVGSLDPAAIDICRRANIELRVESQVSESTLRQRYEGCRFLLSPSLDEGHNLPIAEALSFGANVLCSDIPAHREFYGDRVAFFDPLDVDAIAHAIDLFWMHEGNWFPGVLAPTRSFADVAADYRALFSQVR